jgi:hypothetical protein
MLNLKLVKTIVLDPEHVGFKLAGGRVCRGRDCWEKDTPYDFCHWVRPRSNPDRYIALEGEFLSIGREPGNRAYVRLVRAEDGSPSLEIFQIVSE